MGQVGRPSLGKWPEAYISLFSISCFLFSVIVFGFIKNARAFPKILIIFVGTVEIIPNSPQLVLELLEHLKYL